MLWMFQRVMFGELTKPENKVLKDLSAREILVLSSVTLFIFWIGIYPQTFLSRMEPTVKGYLTQVNASTDGVESPGRKGNFTTESTEYTEQYYAKK